MFERFHGREAVSELFRFEIDCVSTNAYSELKALMDIDKAKSHRQ